MIGVVPQPGATFPYSEFSGRKISPNLVLNAIILLYYYYYIITHHALMETPTILIIFISSLFVGITGYSVYTSFGPPAQNLVDPFEEHED